MSNDTRPGQAAGKFEASSLGADNGFGDRPYANAAPDLFAAGFSPIPVQGKSPPAKGVTGYDGAVVSYADMHTYINGAEGAHNVAIRIGRTIVGIDIDDYDDKHGLETIVRCIERWGELPSTWMSTSRGFGPSGIWLYRVPPGLDYSGAERAVEAIGQNVDIIHFGHRYAMVSPSLHPEGRRYEWYAPGGVRSPTGPASVMDLAELPERWVEALTAKSAPAGSVQPWAAEIPRLDSDHKGPIKHGERNKRLFAYACHLRGTGVPFSDAERAFQSRWLDCEQPQSDRLEWTVAYKTCLVHAYNKYEGGGADAEWAELVPLEPLHTPPAFPVEALPAFAREMVVAVAAATHTPPDLAAMVALGVMSTALGGKVSVQVRRDWTEPAHIYLAVGMPSGTRKSSVFSNLSKPIRHAETELVDSTAIERAEADTELRRLRKRLDNAIATASKVDAKAATTNNDNKDAVDVQGPAKQVRDAEAKQIPCPCLLCDDTTPEKLAVLLAEHGHIGLLSAEGGSILTATGRRYSDIANVDLLLKAHAGEPYRVDRRSAEPIDIRRAALTIAVAVQPRVLADLAADSELRDRGLLARFLICLPPDPVGTRPFDAPDIADAVSAAWSDRIGAAARHFHAAKSITVSATPSAVDVLSALHERIEPRMSSQGDLSGVRDWAGKAVGTAARIAAIVAVVNAKPGENVTVEQAHAESGAAIVECLAEHFCYLLDGLSPVLADARALWQRINRDGYQPEVSVRDLRRQMRGLSDERLRAALKLLTEYGYLMPIEPEPRRGRPSERYRVRKPE